MVCRDFILSLAYEPCLFLFAQFIVPYLAGFMENGLEAELNDELGYRQGSSRVNPKFCVKSV